MKRHITLFIALSLTLSLFAQHNEEVTIEGTYRPKVNKVDKILLKPETPQQTFEMPDTEVHLLDMERHFPIQLDKLNALSYNGKNAALHDPAKNFLMAGFGSRISPLFLYKHNSNLTKNLGLGVGIQHYSSWLDLQDYAPSKFMNNAFEIGLSGGRNNVQWDGDVYYKNDMYYYRDNQLTDPQYYNTIGAHFGLASTSTRNGEFVHQLGADYHHMAAMQVGSLEHFASLDYDLGYADSWWGKKAYPQKVGVALGVKYDHSWMAGYTNQYLDNVVLGVTVKDRLSFKMNPYFEMGDDFYRLHLGVRVDGSSAALPTVQWSVHPDVKGSLTVLNNALEFYAGLNGGQQMVTYSDLARMNPFVRSNTDLEITKVKLGFDGGFRANIMKTLDLHVGVRYRRTENDPFFVDAASSYTPHNSFLVYYDATRTVSVLANVRWLAFDKLTVDAGFAYNNYKMSHEERPWYRPAMEGNLKLNYDVNDKLAFNASFLYQGGLYAKVWNNGPYWMTKYPPVYDVVKLKDVFDLGVGADYRFNDQLTVFVKLDNILNQKYQIYYNYPVAGFQAFAGLKLSF